jgi:inner membrane transporter RhtA
MLIGLLLAFISALAYGANVPFARLSSLAGVSGPDIVFYRSFLLLVVLGGIIRLTGVPILVPRASFGKVLGLGLATSLVGLTYISSVAFIPVGVATIIFYTFPLIILIVSPFIDGERPTLGRIAIFILAFAGLCVAIGPSFTSLDLRGLLLAGVAAIGAAAQFFFAAKATRALPPMTAGFWTQMILMPVALVTCLFIGGPVGPGSLVLAAWPVGMTCGLFVVAFVLHLLAARAAPPAVIGLIYCAEPVTSIALASVVLDERLTLAQLGGGSMVLAAVIAAVLFEGRKKG